MVPRPLDVGMNDIKRHLFGFFEAEHLVITDLDGWYLVEASPWTRTIISWLRKTVVASGVSIPDAESIVASHNRDLLKSLDPNDLDGTARWACGVDR